MKKLKILWKTMNRINIFGSDNFMKSLVRDLTKNCIKRYIRLRYTYHIDISTIKVNI